MVAVEEELARFRAETQQQLSADMQNRIRSLSRDLPQLWADPAVIDRECEEILALLIQDVTVLSEHIEITTHVRLPGGACHTLCTAARTVDLAAVAATADEHVSSAADTHQ